VPLEKANAMRLSDFFDPGAERRLNAIRRFGQTVVDRDGRILVLDDRAANQQRRHLRHDGFERRAIGPGFRHDFDPPVNPAFQTVIADVGQTVQPHPVAQVTDAAAGNHAHQRQLVPQQGQQLAVTRGKLCRVRRRRNRAERAVEIGDQPQTRMLNQRIEQISVALLPDRHACHSPILRLCVGGEFTKNTQIIKPSAISVA